MIQNRRWLLTVLLVLLIACGAFAQKKKAPAKKPVKKTTVQKPKVDKSKVNKAKINKPKTEAPKAKVSKVNEPHDATQDEKKVRDMVAFLEYMLNTIGSNGTTARDKEVLITQSYAKIFRDGKVQVEDDLDENRTVITNKDVGAYLKDVDFFFTDVRFEFIIDNIKSETNTDNKLFYKVVLKRNLKGTTPDGKSINNTVPRFIEINYNPEDQDLRIASIYTNEVSEKDALLNWWKQLSLEWQNIFKKKINYTDSVTLTQIRDISLIEELDLNENQALQTIEPLAYLSHLKSLKLSHTKISDLTPIRNLTELTELDLSHTNIQDLSALKYSEKLTRLNLSNTPVSDISVIQKMPGLQYLELRGTNVNDYGALASLSELLLLNLKETKITILTPLENLKLISELNLSETLVEDLHFIKEFKNLKTLNIDSTSIANITALSSLDNLTVLHANATRIADLQPLQKLAHLQKIYCDQTLIKRTAADAFMLANPNVLVVFDSRDLQAWWNSLSPEWREIISTKAKISLTPAKEELARVSIIDSISLKGQSAIRDLEPLRQLQRLKVIVANATSVTDLSPLNDHREITYLDISNTEVSDVSVLKQFTKLKTLRADKTKVENIDPLNHLTALKTLYVDQTPVHDIIAKEFLEKNPECLIIYKTIHLNRWWSKISSDWKEAFRTQMSADTTSTRENLHRLAEQKTLHFKDAPVSDLTALSEFVQVSELHLSGTNVSVIPALENLRGLRSLHLTSSPLQQVEQLVQFTELEDLDLSNTPIDELKIIGRLQKLKKFNCSGTQIKKLDPLEVLQDLEYLDCSNTRVSQLDHIANLPLKTLKCYNTKISTREIESFKKKHPDCNVIYYR